MKKLSTYIKEKLIINKDYHDAKIVLKSFDELRKIIEDRYKKLGSGTKQDPIDFNDIDVSHISSFYDKNNANGIFDSVFFEYIDISDWNVSNVTDMSYMFFNCHLLKSVGDLSGWDVSNVTDMPFMFYESEKLESVGDISKWDVSNVKDMQYMFYNCPIKEEYKPKFK